MCSLSIGYVVAIAGVVVVDGVDCLVYDWMGTTLELGAIDQKKEKEKVAVGD